MRLQLRRNRVAASVKNDVHRPIAGANRRPRHAIIDSVGDGPMHRGSQHSDQPYNCEPSHKPRQWPKATFSAYGIPCSGTVAAQLSHGFVQIVDRGTVALIETEPQEGGYAKPGRSFRQLGGSSQHQGGSPRVIDIMTTHTAGLKQGRMAEHGRATIHPHHVVDAPDAAISAGPIRR